MDRIVFCGMNPGCFNPLSFQDVSACVAVDTEHFVEEAISGKHALVSELLVLVHLLACFCEVRINPEKHLRIKENVQNGLNRNLSCL